MPLQPTSAQFVEELAAAGDPPLHETTPGIARLGDMIAASLTGRGPDVGSVENRKLDGENGRFRVRVLRPVAPSRGVIVYYHGGGWVLGDIDLQYDFVGRDLANRTQCTVVLVNYRKAPEHRFPTALEDSYTALRWVADEVRENRPLIVAGDSAGGAIAAFMTQRARDADGPRIDYQVLIPGDRLRPRTPVIPRPCEPPADRPRRHAVVLGPLPPRRGCPDLSGGIPAASHQPCRPSQSRRSSTRRSTTRSTTRAQRTPRPWVPQASR